MASHYGGEFDEALRSIREKCFSEIRRPVKVRTVEARKFTNIWNRHLPRRPGLGLAVAYNKRGVYTHFEVYVIRHLSMETAIDTLVHEAAHVCDWWHCGDGVRDDHRDSWGKWYSRVYRAIERGD